MQRGAQAHPAWLQPAGCRRLLRLLARGGRCLSEAPERDAATASVRQTALSSSSSRAGDINCRETKVKAESYNFMADKAGP